MLIFALALLGCDGGKTTDEPVGEDAIRVRLVNPTASDPLAEVDEFRLELVVDGTVVAGDTFGIDEPWTLPGLSEYGLVRFRVAGLSAGEVVSYGRSAETAVVPGVDRDVPITFLPVNEVVPLSADLDLDEGRVWHEVTVLPDGRALIHGGIGAVGNRPKNEMQVYDPSEGAVLNPEITLGYQVSLPVVAWDRQQKLVYAGGSSANSRLNNAAILDPATNTIENLPAMNRQREDHCFEFVHDRFAVAIGGTLPGLNLTAFDTLRVDGAGEGSLVWVEEELSGLDSNGVNSCVHASDGRLFLQGDSEASTGTFSAVESEDGGSLMVSFTPLWGVSQTNSVADFSLGASLIPLETSGDDSPLIWVGGGVDIEAATPVVAGQPRLYNMDEAGFEPGFGADLQPRVFGDWDRWIEPGVVMLACGYTDGNYTAGQGLVELFEPANGASLGWWGLPQARIGCEAAVLKDGSILITGGTPESTETDPWATAILVPYLD